MEGSGEAIIIMKKNLLTTIATALLLGSCTISTAPSDKGGIERTTKQYALKDFSKIALAGSGSVEFTQGKDWKVEAIGPENIIDRLDIKVENNTLSIALKDRPLSDNAKFRVFGDGTYHVTVQAPALEAVAIAGSGEFECEKALKTDRLDLAVAGSGDMDFPNVHANEINASIAGSGEIDFSAKSVKQTNLSIAGSGDIEAEFQNCGAVKADIAGSGEMRLSGEVRSLESKSKNVRARELKINK